MRNLGDAAPATPSSSKAKRRNPTLGCGGKAKGTDRSVCQRKSEPSPCLGRGNLQESESDDSDALDLKGLLDDDDSSSSSRTGRNTKMTVWRPRPANGESAASRMDLR